MVVNNNAAAVLLVLAALADDRGVVVSRGRERRDRRRLPRARRDGAVRRAVCRRRHHQPHPPGRLRQGDRSPERRRRAGAEGAPVSNFRIEGSSRRRRSPSWPTLGVPVVADIGSGLIDANCPWLGGPPPAWLAGEPAARQTLGGGAALVTFSGDKLLGGPQAGIIAGRARPRRRCAAHPLARALRPGGHVLAALQAMALAYLGRTVASDDPVLADGGAAGRRAPRAGATRSSPPRARARSSRDRGGPRRRFGARRDDPVVRHRRSTATTSPRCGRRRPPIVARIRDGRTFLDLRTVDPGDDDLRRSRALTGLAPMRVVATAGHVDHGKSSLVLALTGTDPDRFEEEKRRGLTIDLGFAHTTLPSGAGISFIDVPGHVRFLRNMLAGVGGVDACLFVVAATEGWKPQCEEHLRILELLGIGHGVIVLTKVDLVDDESLELARARRRRSRGRHVPRRRRRSWRSARRPAPGSTSCGPRSTSSWPRTPPAPDRGRPRLWIDRVFAAKGSGTVVTGTLTGGAIRRDDQLVVEPGARAGAGPRHPDPRRRSRRDRPGNRVALNLSGVDHDELHRGDCVVAPGSGGRPTASTPRSTCSPRSTTRCRAAAPTWPTSARANCRCRLRVLGAEALAPGGDGLGATAPARCRCRCCPAIGTCCASRAATRRSAVARCSTSRRSRRRRRPRPTAPSSG